MIKLLVFSSLFPSTAQPLHGLFVAQRLVKVLESGEAVAHVVAPVPWFPSKSPRFGQYATFAMVPDREVRNGLDVHHPRFVRLPKVGMNAAPLAMALGALPTVRRVMAAGFDFDVIDAHYYYPDGVAAAILGRWLNRPVIISARGTDINLIADYRGPRAQILWAADRANASIAVCRSLKDKMRALGADESKIHVLRNGVDLQRFDILDQRESRLKLGLGSGRWLLSVGQLVANKGHDIAIKALRELSDWSLLIVGSGESEERLRRIATEFGVHERVRFAGGVPQTNLPLYYSAADFLVLASGREGWANVLLESMACGTPVIATAVGGTPEVVASDAAGVLMRERSPSGLVAAVQQVVANRPDRLATRRYAERFDWSDTTKGQLDIFERAASHSSAAAIA